MPGAQRIKELVEKEFEEYMNLVNSNSLAFGISADKFCSKIKKVRDFIEQDKSCLEIALEVEFKSDAGENPDYIFINPSSSIDGLEITMNRKYNSGNSVVATGLTSSVSYKRKVYDLVVSSSEVARNRQSSIYDFVVSIQDSSSDNPVIVKEKYAMERRENNPVFVGNFLNDLRKYLGAGNDPDSVKALLEDDKERYGVYLANTEKRLIKDRELSLTPADDGFSIQCNNCHCDNPVFYHDNYDRPWISSNDAKVFEGLYEEDVYNLLNLEGDIQKKLDICMIIFENKQRLESFYPVDRITV